MGTWQLGQTSKHYESGKNGAGTISSGSGDHGGVSYGTYQLSSNMNRVQEFIASSQYKNDFAGLQVNSLSFKDKWKELAAHDPKFGEAQHGFIERTHFQPQMHQLQTHGLDLSKHGPAVQDMVWSTSVQFGPTTKVVEKAIHSKFGQNVDVSNCLVPIFNGVSYNQLKEQQPWVKYYTETPRLRTLREQKYKTLQRASLR